MQSTQTTQLRTTVLKLKLIEGSQLSLTEQQHLMEFAPAVLLLSWLKGEATNWLANQITSAIKGDPTAERNAENTANIKSQLQSELGDHAEEIGSGLASFVSNLISKGNPVAAAIATGKQLAQEYAKAAAGTAVGSVAVASGLVDPDTVRSMGIELAKIEPAANKLEAAASQTPQPQPTQAAPTVQPQPT